MAEITNLTNGSDQDYSQTCADGPDAAVNEVRPLYAFDAQQFEIGINVRPYAETPFYVTHKLRRPSMEELLEREQMIVSEIVEVSPREDRVIVDDDTANWRLWDRIVLEIRGYDFNDGVPDHQWRAPTEEQKARILWSHKATAVRGMYAADCRIVDEGAFNFELVRLRQDIGYRAEPEFQVYYEMRIPTESERQKFKSQSTNTQYVRGARKSRARIVSNLKSFAAFFDQLVTDIDGATVAGVPFAPAGRAAFLAAIDPIWKRQIINTLISQLESQLQD